MTKTVAILDENSHLVGTKKKSRPAKGDLAFDEEIDLPTDGTYRWDPVKRAFYPLGTGRERVGERPPVSDDYALFAVIRHLGADAPVPARQWADWYERHIKQREEEKQLSRARKARR